MKLRNILIALLVIALTVPSAAFGRDNKFKHNGELTIWNYKPHGELNLGNSDCNLKTNIQGDKVSGMGKETSAGFGWTYSLGKLSDLYVHYNKIETSGRVNVYATAARPIFIDGKQFTTVGGAGLIDMKLKLDVFDILGSRELTKGEKGYVDFVYGFKVVKFHLDASDVASAASANYSLTLPIPNFGIRGFYEYNKNWGIYGMVSGFSINRSGKSAKLSYVDAGVQYHFASTKDEANKMQKVEWYAQLGYQAQSIKGDDDKNHIEFVHEGPIFKIIGRF